MEAPSRLVQFRRMGRTRRENLPGAPFHLIARIQDGKPLFTGAEPVVLETIDRTARESRVRLLAYAVMSNHLHLVVVQGREPLSHFMQSLLRRLALFIQRRHGCEGHVFQSRYRAHPCLDARRLRSALVYVHLNPVRAGVCTDPLEYEWTSHASYCGNGLPISSACAELGLRLFADERNTSADACRNAYRQFIAWRLRVDALQQQQQRTVGDWAVKPTADGGDDAWWDEFASASSKYTPALDVRPDLEAIARRALSAQPYMTLDVLRSGGRTPGLTAARCPVIERALQAGYANYQIARYLRISASVVSRVASEIRSKAARHAQTGHPPG
jgi:REP element-mobilizing transposase RayT